MEAFVTHKIENGLATVQFFHPAHNSLPGNLLKELADTIDALGQHEQVNLVLLCSAGEKTFCAGASFDELAAINDRESGKIFFSGFAKVILAIRNCPKIVLCRVHGKAIGGGVGLAAAADYSLASKYASIRLSELAVGIGPFVIGPAVERKIGKAAFQMMAINPDEWQTAEFAKQKGLFNEVFETTEQLDAYIQHFTSKLISYNPAALFKLKSIFWEGTENWDQLLFERAAISGELVLSDYCKKAIGEFKAKG
ncbi:MAG: enoyl-CoA hydratase/isomerase family protein [Saprospiraceae bacterium]|nr:enoyl-CoA hydratase/isomerase family protein [Saprospiraceae bacterium]